ncbi:ATP-dependent Clp protease proteolytic subunit, partial [Bacillus subtilis]|uniref:ATP-dependent Clp protease proteolytic subunit n=1 Tax=Bacillus subtilis TaxID=1423 RepID=UPI0016435409
RKYEDVMGEIVGIEENGKIEGLVMILNSVGGDVEGGVGIGEMVGCLWKGRVCMVVGGGD